MWGGKCPFYILPNSLPLPYLTVPIPWQVPPGLHGNVCIITSGLLPQELSDRFATYFISFRILLQNQGGGRTEVVHFTNENKQKKLRMKGENNKKSLY